MKRKRLALFAVGGVGVGIFSQGLPTIAKIVDRLSEKFDVTFYSLVPTDPGFRPSLYVLRSPPAWLRKLRIKGVLWLYLFMRFLYDHFRNRSQALLSFWGYPMGTFVVGLSKLLRVPSIVVILGAEVACLPAINYGQLRRPLSRRLVLETCARASKLVLISSYQLDILDKQGLRREDAHVIPWGADKEMFHFTEKSLAPPLKIVHVANLTEVKDQKTLVSAFGLLRKDVDAKLRFVGPDFMNGQIQNLTKELELMDDVEFLGAVPFSEIPEHYKWADIFLLTSLSEGQNGAATEAIMCGVLAVGTPVGLFKDLGAEATVIVKEGDPVDIAAKIKNIMNDPSAWKEKVTKAKEWATTHDFDWTIEQLTALIHQTT
jgi:glycosyltransferase involved in cell wall biosynthesis